MVPDLGSMVLSNVTAARLRGWTWSYGKYVVSFALTADAAGTFAGLKWLSRDVERKAYRVETTSSARYNACERRALGKRWLEKGARRLHDGACICVRM
jgi:hypothetical protein